MKKALEKGFIDLATGEEIKGRVVVVKENEKMKAVKYEDFAAIDSQAMKKIRPFFNVAEIGRIMLLAQTLDSAYNVPHTPEGNFYSDEELMEYLEYTRNRYHDFMKKLVLHDVIQYLPVTVKGRSKKVAKLIMVNPHFAKKRKTIHIECLNKFNNFSKASKTLK